MVQLEFEEVVEALCNGPVKATFYDGLHIYLESAIPEKKAFIGYFSLCCGNKNPQLVEYTTLKEFEL